MGRETTITLDEDVAAKLDREAQRTGADTQQIANDVLRKVLGPADEPKRAFVVRARDLGVRPGVDYDCAWRLLHNLDSADSK